MRIMDAENHRSVRQKRISLRGDAGASHNETWRGYFEGRDIGAAVTVFFFSSDETGQGPPLHVHPYDEVFIVRRGRALFTIGGRTVHASAGDILLGPANLAHKFHNVGPGRLETIDIHLSDRWIQRDLEDHSKTLSTDS